MFASIDFPPNLIAIFERFFKKHSIFTDFLTILEAGVEMINFINFDSSLSMKSMMAVLDLGLTGQGREWTKN